MWRKPPAGPVTPSLPGCSYAAPPVHPLGALQQAPPSPGMQKLCKFLLSLLNSRKEELILPFLQQIGDRTKGNPWQERILQQGWGGLGSPGTSSPSRVAREGHGPSGLAEDSTEKGNWDVHMQLWPASSTRSCWLNRADLWPGPYGRAPHSKCTQTPK